MNWYVTIDYKRGPSFGFGLEADTEQRAIDEAKSFAAACGYIEKVKSVKAQQITAQVSA